MRRGPSATCALLLLTHADVNRGRDLTSGLKRALHPRVPMRHVIPCQIQAALRLDQHGVRLLTRLRRERRPRAIAPRYAVPGHGEAVLELDRILRVNPPSLFERKR